ncbi:MAG: hypothetical protein ACD_7C00056G0003 [uncultured bacterium]|nr:MAG: hypothetical protein ACD_7C00056G0003 [uncultured bacterium]
MWDLSWDFSMHKFPSTEIYLVEMTCMNYKLRIENYLLNDWMTFDG